MSDRPDETTDDATEEKGSILEDGGVDTDERAGRSLGIEPEKEPDEDTKEEIEQTREERLDPDNRPDGAEVDNTDREFDVDHGMFKDSEGYDESDPVYTDPEDPNSDASPDTDDEDSDEEDES